MSQPVRIYRSLDQWEMHPACPFWACFALAYYLIPAGFFLEFGDRDNAAHAQLYWMWFLSVWVFAALALIMVKRYFMLVLSPIFIYAVFSAVAEVRIFIFQMDPNGDQVLQIKRDLLNNCGFCAIFFLILLQAFPWENLRSRIGQ